MGSQVLGASEREGLTLMLGRLEHRLGIALALLVLGIAGVLASVGIGPGLQYLTGPEIPIVAGMSGEGCGSHLEWGMQSREIDAGSRVTIMNDSTYWRIPVVIERYDSDGSWKAIAESPTLRDGESWSHTFWRGGTFRIVSADETQRLAGLEAEVSVE